MEMGYTLDIEYNRLVVQGVLDYDRVVVSHRDCLLAEVESQVLNCYIWKFTFKLTLTS